ncbi:MAG: hypothetical protein AAFP86_24885, partial [Planctomycetota bacterium]
DNIEAQATDAYVAPSGTGNGITDANNDGLDDVYDTRAVISSTAAATAADARIVPVDSDNDGDVDLLDTDSDDEGGTDTEEAGLTGTPIANGTLSDSSNDADGDGLFDVFETQGGTTATDGFVVNEGVADPLTAAATANGYLPDDGDAVAGSIVPLTADLNYRDAVADPSPPVANDDTAT